MDKESHKKILIVVAGATASGKTSLSINLAKRYGSDIISADSRQVYKEMSIGTAKPGIEEMKGIPHHFIDNVSIFENYNVGIYEKEVIKFLDDYFKSKNIAILTGGTGLYINAVINGIDEFPEIDKTIKNVLISEYEQKGIGFLQEKLKEVDPEHYKIIDLNNSHRLIRALSVIRQSGKTYTSFTNQKKKERNFDVIKLFLDWPREELYTRINDRVDIMMDMGLEAEAAKLYKYSDLKALQTVGYKELFEYFDGNSSKAEAVELIKRNTRRYAKRQLTWFRNQGQWNIFEAQKPTLIYDFIKLKAESL